MEIILSCLALVFSMLFFVLGVLVKITLSFRDELRESLLRYTGLFWAHKHSGSGRAYTPRASNGPTRAVQAKGDQRHRPANPAGTAANGGM